VLTNIHQNPEVRGATVAPGDVVYTDASHSVVFNTVSASAYDATTGVLDASGNLATYAGVAANTYYDGSTSDYITEAPSNASGVVNLRKPSTGSVSIPWINVNDLSLNSFASDKILQDSSANPGTEEQTTTFDGAHGWSDTWHSCH